jgi:hypothetical protein
VAQNPYSFSVSSALCQLSEYVESEVCYPHEGWVKAASVESRLLSETTHSEYSMLIESSYIRFTADTNTAVVCVLSAPFPVLCVANQRERERCRLLILRIACAANSDVTLVKLRWATCFIAEIGRDCVSELRPSDDSWANKKQQWNDTDRRNPRDLETNLSQHH